MPSGRRKSYPLQGLAGTECLCSVFTVTRTQFQGHGQCWGRQGPGLEDPCPAPLSPCQVTWVVSQMLSGPQFPPLANRGTLLGDSVGLSINEIGSPGVVRGPQVGLGREAAIYRWDIWHYMDNPPADPWKPAILALPVLSSSWLSLLFLFLGCDSLSPAAWASASLDTPSTLPAARPHPLPPPLTSKPDRQRKKRPTDRFTECHWMARTTRVEGGKGRGGEEGARQTVRSRSYI